MTLEQSAHNHYSLSINADFVRNRGFSHAIIDFPYFRSVRGSRGRMEISRTMRFLPKMHISSLSSGIEDFRAQLVTFATLYRQMLEITLLLIEECSPSTHSTRLFDSLKLVHSRY